MHTHASHFRHFLRVSHNAASFYLGTTAAVIQIGRRWQLWIPSVWCHSLSLSLWTGDRQSFLRLMPVLPSALKHGNYTSFYVPLVQACDSNSEPISDAVLLRITAWQRGVTMCMLSWKKNSEITHVHVPSFISVMEWCLSQWKLPPESFPVLIFWSNIRLHWLSNYNVEF